MADLSPVPRTRGDILAVPRTRGDELFPAHAGMNRPCCSPHQQRSLALAVPRTRGDEPV